MTFPLVPHPCALQAPTYRTEIDGLRAVAVLPIIFFHFNLGPKGGFVGVDVFYVISGFLITRILLSDLEAGRPLSDFYVRRTRRLFPTLVVVLVTVLLAGRVLLQASMFKSLCYQARAVLLLVANFHTFGTVDYFFNDLQAPLLHCWSLAVEEQFYIIYPFLWWFFRARSWSVRCSFWALLVIGLSSLFASAFLTRMYPSFAFYLLPTRAWELILGGIVALDQGTRFLCHRVAAELASWCGLIMIIVSLSLLDSSIPFPGTAALLPCCGTALVIASQCKHNTFCGRLLSAPWLAIVGKMSYSLYLWHWPIFNLLALTAGSLQLKLSAMTTSIGLLLVISLSLATFFLVERPFRSENGVPLRVFMPGALGAWLALIAFTTVAPHLASDATQVVFLDNKACTLEHGLPDFLKPAPSVGFGTCLDYPSVAQLDELYATNLSKVRASNLGASFEKADSCWKYSHETERIVPDSHRKNETTGWRERIADWAADKEPLIVGAPLEEGKHPSIVAIGSSHCSMWGESIERLAKEYGKTVGIFCLNAVVGKFNSPLTAWDETRLSYIKQWQPETVVWADSWGGFFCGPFNIEYDLDLLLPHTKKILLVGDVPGIPLGPRNGGAGALKQVVLRKGASNEGFRFMLDMTESHAGCRQATEDSLRAVASSPTYKSRVTFAPVINFYQESKKNHLMLVDPCKGTLIYADGNHVTLDGSRRADPLFRKEIFGHQLCS